jgi:hypothetical protein
MHWIRIAADVSVGFMLTDPKGKPGKEIVFYEFFNPAQKIQNPYGRQGLTNDHAKDHWILREYGKDTASGRFQQKGLVQRVRRFQRYRHVEGKRPMPLLAFRNRVEATL